MAVAAEAARSEVQQLPLGHGAGQQLSPVVETAEVTRREEAPQPFVDRPSCEASLVLPGLGNDERGSKWLVRVGGLWVSKWMSEPVG